MLERDGTQVENQFKGGRLAVWIGGPWVLRLDLAHRRQDTGSRRRARTSAWPPMPTGPAGKAFTFVGGSDLMVFKASKHQNEAWALSSTSSSDQTQKDYANLLGMFPARLDAAAAGRQLRREPQGVLHGHQGTAAPTRRSRSGAQIENAYKGRFGNILDTAAGQRQEPFSEAEVKSQLDAAAKEADGLLAQGG